MGLYCSVSEDSYIATVFTDCFVELGEVSNLPILRTSDEWGGSCMPENRIVLEIFGWCVYKLSTFFL